MNYQTFTVARWEFTRFFRWKDQLLAVVSLIVGAAIGIGAVKLARSSSTINLVAVGSIAGLKLPEASRIQLTESSDSVASLRHKLQQRQIDGVLVLSSRESGAAELIVRTQPAWLDELQPALDAMKLKQAVASAELTPQLQEQLFSPFDVKVTSVTDHTVSRSDKLVAVGLVCTMILVSWMGLAFMLVGITGEKQMRVTEQIVSAITPQAWIDGKLLGLTAAAFASLGSMFVTGAGAYLVWQWTGGTFRLPSAMQRWDLLPLLLVLCVGGALFWNCFYAMVSAIINDPNTSSRNSLLMVPTLPMTAAVFAMPKPDSVLMRWLSVLPGTSSTAMPIRLLVGEVTWWEIAVCITLLAAGIWFLRRVAGRVFAAGMMLYGKEPTWFDVARWALTRN